MGKKNSNSTKSGRFMNPTDQLRKEARRKELKRNKSQRMAVRTALLKARDPIQLLEEATLYDKQEYDPNAHPSLNEKVLQDKRKKLLETFDKTIQLYSKEDPETYKQLMKARVAYDKRRTEMVLYYEQVKLTKHVKATEIPLPSLPQFQNQSNNPALLKFPVKAISIAATIKKKPAGPPPGLPPDLSDSDSEDTNGKYSLDMNQVRRMTTIAQPTGLMMNAPSIDQVHMSRFTSAAPGIPSTSNMLPKFLPPMSAVMFGKQHQHAMQSSTQQLTIEAKPKLKNLIADATRFIPTSLKVRRTAKDSKTGKVETYGTIHSEYGLSQQHAVAGNYPSQVSRPTKDDAYDEFMREMQNIL